MKLKIPTSYMLTEKEIEQIQDITTRFKIPNTTQQSMIDIIYEEFTKVTKSLIQNLDFTQQLFQQNIQFIHIQNDNAPLNTVVIQKQVLNCSNYGKLSDVFIHPKHSILYFKFHDPRSTCYEAHELNFEGKDLIIQFLQTHQKTLNRLLSLFQAIPTVKRKEKVLRAMTDIGIISNSYIEDIPTLPGQKDVYIAKLEIVSQIQPSDEQFNEYEPSEEGEYYSDDEDDKNQSQNHEESESQEPLYDYDFYKEIVMFTSDHKKYKSYTKFHVQDIRRLLDQKVYIRNEIRQYIFTKQAKESCIQCFIDDEKLFFYNNKLHCLEYLNDTAEDLKEVALYINAHLDYYVQFIKHYQSQYNKQLVTTGAIITNTEIYDDFYLKYSAGVIQAIKSDNSSKQSTQSYNLNEKNLVNEDINMNNKLVEMIQNSTSLQLSEITNTRLKQGSVNKTSNRQDISLKSIDLQLGQQKQQNGLTPTKLENSVKVQQPRTQLDYLLNQNTKQKQVYQSPYMPQSQTQQNIMNKTSMIQDSFKQLLSQNQLQQSFIGPQVDNRSNSPKQKKQATNKALEIELTKQQKDRLQQKYSDLLKEYASTQQEIYKKLVDTDLNTIQNAGFPSNQIIIKQKIDLLEQLQSVIQFMQQYMQHNNCQQIIKK